MFPPKLAIDTLAKDVIPPLSLRIAKATSELQNVSTITSALLDVGEQTPALQAQIDGIWRDLDCRVARYAIRALTDRRVRRLKPALPTLIRCVSGPYAMADEAASAIATTGLDDVASYEAFKNAIVEQSMQDRPWMTSFYEHACTATKDDALCKDFLRMEEALLANDAAITSHSGLYSIKSPTQRGTTKGLALAKSLMQRQPLKSKDLETTMATLKYLARSKFITKLELSRDVAIWLQRIEQALAIYPDCFTSRFELYQNELEAAKLAVPDRSAVARRLLKIHETANAAVDMSDVERYLIRWGDKAVHDQLRLKICERPRKVKSQCGFGGGSFISPELRKHWIKCAAAEIP